MADSERDLKLAAARKRLKKFQQKRTPSSSPAIRKTSPNSSVASSNSTPKTSNSPVCASPIDKQPPDIFNHVAASPDVSVKNEENEKDKFIAFNHSDPHHEIPEPIPSPTAKNVTSNHISALSNGSDVSTTEKIRQMCNQLNGLMKQDFPINGEDPVISEIEGLERRNLDLEETLLSHKRSNDHLNNQVNEQRKQILHFQEQLKRERTELANRQLLEQRSLKEQLEVHIQTIGILVGEKQELQSTVSQLQRKYQTKESENSELSGRLQAVRQKIVELERNNASLSANLEKYQNDFNHTRQERDKYQTANYTYNREKDELAQQNAELKSKLEVKVSECEELENKTTDLSFKFTQAELIIQQLSNDFNSVATQSLVQQLQDEKSELETKLDQLTKSLHRYETDREEILATHTDELEQFESRTRSLQHQVENFEKEKAEWENREFELEDRLHNLQKNIDDFEEEEVSHQVEATQQAAVEIEKLSEERKKLVEHLQNQARENAKLVKDEALFLHRIHELEITVGRLEEEAEDRASLLETVQGDKETISRALKQNKELKTQLEEIEDRFVKMSNENMELATHLETEKHVAKELAIKLSETAVELEETKETYQNKEEQLKLKADECQALKKQMNEKSEELRSSHDEHDLSLQGLQQQLSHKDFELSSLRDEVDVTTQRLSEEVKLQVSDHQQEYEAQMHKMELLYRELQRSEETIEQLVMENKHLRTVIDTHEDETSDDEASTSTEEVHYKDHDESPSTQHSDGTSGSEELHIEKVPPEELHINNVPLENHDDVRMEAREAYQQEGSYINGDMYGGPHEETDLEEEMDMVPYRPGRSPPPISKYTSREDVINGLSASIRQLELERDQMSNILQGVQDNHENEMKRLQEHMELQLQQQLKQQYKQVQEQFQQQLHEQQQKIQLLQEVLERQKARIERQSEEEELPEPATEANEEQDNMTYDALKTAFGKLQGRFLKIMEEKASLVERIQELEHLTVQLSEETETIGEYISLYQTQRASLKAYYHDRERIITQMSNDKGDMQNKISQLQELVKQLLEDRKDLRSQQHQLQNMVNKRMLAHEHESVIPGYQDGDEIIIQQSNDGSLRTEPENSTFNSSSEYSMDSGGIESPSPIQDSAETTLEDDGTAQQILQLLEQLGPSEEGAGKGWMSPVVRTREFMPCRHCTTSRLLRL